MGRARHRCFLLALLAAACGDTRTISESDDYLDRYEGGALVLPSFKAIHVAFSPQLKRIALVNDRAGFPSDLVLVDLRTLDSEVVSREALFAEWIDERRLLISEDELQDVTVRYRLGVYRLDDRKLEPLGEVRSHKLTPDGSRVIAVRETSGNKGTLYARDLEPLGPWRKIKADVSPFVEVSRDSRWIAFTTGGWGCLNPPEAKLYVHDLQQWKTTLVHKGPIDHPQFTRDGRLLFQACPPGPVTIDSTLKAFLPPTGPPVEVAKGKLHWGTAWDRVCPGFNRYHVSSDGAFVLGVEQGELKRVSLAAKGAKVIATGVADGNGQRYEAFGFSKDGQWALMIQDKRLAAVPVGGGAVTTLSADLATPPTFAVSPVADEVAFCEKAKPSAKEKEIKRVDIQTGKVEVLHRAVAMPEVYAGLTDEPPAYLPDGRGLLWTGPPSYELLYIPRSRSGGQPTALGRLDRPYLGCFGRVVDPSGRLVAFNSPGGLRVAWLPGL